MRKLQIAASLLLTVVLAPGARGQDIKPATTAADDFVSAEPPATLPEPLTAGLAAIKAPALAAHVAFLAAPSMEGRGLASRGLDAAAEYVAASLALAGIPPLAGTSQGSAAGASYFQTVPLRELREPSGEVTVERRSGDELRTRAFRSGVDCLLPPLPAQSVTAPVVFAGYGIREPGLGRDDYHGLEVRGRIVLVLGGLPPGPEWQKPELEARYNAADVDDRYIARLELLSGMGAAAVLAVEAEDWATRVLAKEPADTRSFLPFEEPARGDREPPLVPVSPLLADALLAAVGLDSGSARSAAARALPGVTATIRTSAQERLVVSRNVLGFISGSDPQLRQEAVVIGAHLDHLGRSGDVIYPGADDNASGVAALLEIAKAFRGCQRPPRRSLIFAFWTGEEDGKLGSGAYVRHPLWPLARTAAYLNLDMIGHPWSPEEIRKLVTDSGLANGEQFLAAVRPADFAEPGLAEWAPELAVILGEAGRGTGLTLHLDRSNGLHGGSDYREFARAHVPWVRFFGNFFPGYHQPTDTPDRLDPVQVQRLARLCFATAYLLADR